MGGMPVKQFSMKTLMFFSNSRKIEKYPYIKPDPISHMTYKFKILCCIIALILYHSAAIGDEAPLVQQESGGVVSPVSEDASIRMDSEQVKIRLEEDSYSVDAEFIFYNTGETVTKLVGFPRRNYLTTRTI